jgi:glutathione synthase/RimK-type ligase-like ATP-grasp enzyme
MRLCIFGRDDDPLSAHTAERAVKRGHHVLRAPLGQIVDGAPIAFDGASWLFRGEEIDSYDAFVLRAYPAPHALLAPPETCDTAAGWFRRGMLQRERSSFAQSLLMDLEQRGKPIVNPLFASAPWDHKPLQLAQLQRAGIPIPRTLITNFPDAVNIFRDEVGECIYKPTAGGAEARLVDDALMARINDIASSPVIFQQRVTGPDVRVTVVGGRVVSSVIIESDTLDYRTSATYRSGGATYTPHQLPSKIETMCVEIAKMFSHVLSGIDLKHRGGDDYVVLEANSGPVYLDVELKTGAPITDAIIAWCESGVVRAPVPAA